MKPYTGIRRMHQRGITFLGILFIAIIAAFVLIMAAKVVPSVLEYQALVKAVNRARDKQTVADIQRAFDASAAIDDFTAISGKDLEVTKEDDQIKIHFAYDKKITLFGPVSLLIHYSGDAKGA